MDVETKLEPGRAAPKVIILTGEMTEQVADLARVVEPEMTIHDFRVVRGPTHTNVIFDAVVPHKCRLTDEEVLQRLRQAVSTLDPAYQAVIQIDRAYVE